MKRAYAIISGRVQKAGYRDFVDDIAYKYKINGFVRNLKDKSVEVVAEGEEALLDSFFKEIEIKVPPIIVENISITWEDYKDEFSFFEIIREDGFAELGERIDTANSYLITIVEMQKETVKKLDTSLEKQDQMLDKQDQMLDKQDQMLDKQDLMISKQDLMIDKQDQMISKQDQMLNKQDQMLNKQDQMLNKQDRMIDLQTENNAELKGLRNDTKTYLDRRFSEIQNELTDIKSALNKAGIKI